MKKYIRIDISTNYCGLDSSHLLIIEDNSSIDLDSWAHEMAMEDIAPRGVWEDITKEIEEYPENIDSFDSVEEI